GARLVLPGAQDALLPRDQDVRGRAPAGSPLGSQGPARPTVSKLRKLSSIPGRFGPPEIALATLQPLVRILLPQAKCEGSFVSWARPLFCQAPQPHEVSQVRKRRRCESAGHRLRETLHGEPALFARLERAVFWQLNCMEGVRLFCPNYPKCQSKLRSVLQKC